MKNIASPSDINTLIVDVSEEIKKKNLLNFVYTSLDINNISYSLEDLIYTSFLKHSNQYQIFIFSNTFKYMLIELLNDKNSSEKENPNSFELYITKSFFTIYKNSKLYAYQVLNHEYSKNEVVDFISKSFNITISNIKELSDLDLSKLCENNKNKKADFSNINKQSNKSFLIYIVYLIICIIFVLAYKDYKSNTYKNKSLEKIEASNNEYIKIAKMLKFKPLKIEYERLVTTANKFHLKILSFNHTSKYMNIKVSAKDKQNIYLFLEEYQKKLLGNSIVKDESKRLFISTINVKSN